MTVGIGVGIGVAVFTFIIIIVVMIIAKKKKSSINSVSNPVETNRLKKSTKVEKSPNYTELGIKQPSDDTELNFTESLIPNTNSGEYNAVCSASSSSGQYETVLTVNVSDSDHVYSKINNYMNLSDF